MRYVKALISELRIRHSYIAEPPSTIYLGGGTPSQLSSEALLMLFDAIDFSNASEITMECNPDDITPEFADTLNKIPVNRVSMGVQTFNDDRLRFLHRRHNSDEVFEAVRILRNSGIANISIDLMYGFSEETIDQWQEDIEQALTINPEHISAYCLSYEEGTPLYNMLKKGTIRENDEESCRTMYYKLIDRLKEAGYEHYEISNFARNGFQSRHNSGYWSGIPYLGIGAGAHSYNTTSRQWNIADIDTYMAEIEQNKIPAEREELDTQTRYNDTVMLSLRTSQGINLDEIEHNFSSYFVRFCLKAAECYIRDGLLINTDNHLRLTRKGLFVSDMIMSDLMYV